MRVVVVGAGLGGLSAACHLTGRGHHVVVVERGDAPGGLAGQWRSEGFTIDTGPSVLTMPGVLKATFAAVGADMDRHLRLRPLDPLYKAGFDGESPIRLWREQERTEQEIRERCGAADAAGFARFRKWLERLYALEHPAFIDRNVDGPLDLLRPAGPALQLARLGALRRMAPVVSSYFRDERLRKVFSFQALYAGLSPYDALAVYCVITYMDTVAGVWFPDGGIHAVATGLAAAAARAGVRFLYSSPATRIVRRLGTSGPVTGVRLQGGEVLPADAVVCNADAASVYRDLLSPLPEPRAVRRGEYSPSCSLWLAGVRGALPAGTAHHNLHFTGDWGGSFESLLRRGTRQADPSILVSVPTVSDPGLAPPGGQVLYALEPVPNLDGQLDWRYERHAARASLLERLADLGYPVADVVTERFVDPTDWDALGLPRGTPFSLSHRFFQSGPWRTPNVDRRVPGLVLAGASTVPGVGIPMVLISGRLAAERVQQLAEGG